MTLLKQGLNVINITISSKAHRDMSKPSLSIEQLSVFNVSTDIIYESPNVSYYNKESPFPVEAFWTLYLFNLNDDEIGTVYLLLKYKLHSTTVTIGEKYSFTVVYDDRVLEYRVPTNKPIIYQDEDLRLMSEIHKLFDGNFTTCVGLPVQGESPPWFWMRLNTTWLNISSSTFGVRVVGNQISCQPNGRTLLQIAYPLESPIFENELKHRMEFCILTNITSNRRVVECDYHCQCSKGNDCQEMILFMANQEKMAPWSLCEISARNVV
nr:uncharacterized protein LOC109620938 [Crassostrea gigas]